MEELIVHFAGWGAAGILLALFVGTFISEDLACLAAGSLAAGGQIDLVSAIGVCFAGIFIGDLSLYGAGRFFGPRVLGSQLSARFITEEQLTRASAWLSERGASAVFLSRFVSGFRLPTYIAAGALRIDPTRFAIHLALAAAVWTPLLVGVAATWQMAVPGGAIAGFVIAFVIFRYAFRLTDGKKGRLAWARVQRLKRWEFWPLWVFYLPVVVYVLTLAARYRGLTFAAANPSLPAGGFVGESKDEIYRLIEQSAAARNFILRYTRIAAGSNAEARYRAAVRFIDIHSISFPIAVKPDVGERGDGVSIARNDAELRAALTRLKGDVLVQEFFDGVEASVFYYRMPGEAKGRVFSITEKVLPSVTGDGSSTLEELILRDGRAYILAKKYFDRNALRLRTVPAYGDIVRLVDIGSHSKGAIFLDGEHLRTPELESKLDEISRGISGFYFGRFDIRASSFHELKQGRNFRIIELNGVTSESTNIYDPRYSLLEAYGILFAQWRLAFEIGSRNIDRGIQGTTLRELASLILHTKLPARQSGNVRPVQRLS